MVHCARAKDLLDRLGGHRAFHDVCHGVSGACPLGLVGVGHLPLLSDQEARLRLPGETSENPTGCDRVSRKFGVPQFLHDWRKTAMIRSNWVWAGYFEV